MSIVSRINEMTAHIGNAYNVLEVAGADLTNIDKNILNLKATWQERLLYFINNGIDVVWNNWDKVTGEGTTLTLNNTEEAPMEINLKGNTSQEGTPTPDSPVPVQVVSGNNSIVVCGKNLFNETYYNNVSLYTKYGNFYAYVEMPDTFKTKFYVNMSLKGTSQTLVWGFTTEMSGTFSGGIKVLNYGTLNINVECDFTNAEHVYMAIGNGSSIALETDIPKIFDNYNIIVSTTSNESYKPYQSQSYLISLGDIQLLHIPNTNYYDKIDKSSRKNLFDESYYNNYNLYTKNGNFYAYIEMPDSFKTKFYGNMSLKGTAQNLLFGFSTSNNSTPQNLRMLNAGTINSNIEYDFANATNVYLIIGNGNGITLATDIPKIFDNYNIMVSTISNESYEPYGTSWYLKKEIGKYNLSSIPFSAFNSSSTNTTRVVWYSIGRNYQGDIALCDKLPNDTNVWNKDVQAIAVSYSTGYVIVRINKSIVGTTEEEINTYLSNNDLIFYSPLATPTYTEITDSTLISQLEALEKVISYDEQTNISQNNNDLPFTIKAKALIEF